MNQPKKYEARFTEKDLKIVKSKSKKSYIVWFIASIILGVISYGLLKKPGFDFVGFLAIFFFIISLTPYLHFFYKSPTKLDLEDKIKISTELKVKYKRTNLADDDIGYQYEIEFEENPDFYKYGLLEEDYDKISVGDTIYLEFTKQARWILKIEWKDQDIENPFYVK